MGVDCKHNLVVREIAQNTSIHGVRQLSLTYHYSKFILFGWICIIGVAFATICYQLSMLTSLVLTYPSTVELSISLEPSVFPTVTACNMGVYKKSVVENIYSFTEMGQTLNIVSSGQRYKREVTEDVNGTARSGQVIDPVEAASQNVLERRSKRAISCANSCNATGDICLYPFLTTRTGLLADSACAGIGGKLPFFSTMAQYNSYNVFRLARAANHILWLGFWNFSPHNATNPGIWRDSNGTGSILSLSNWNSAEPNGGTSNSENCAGSDATAGGGWMDQPCSLSFYFMCMCQCPTIVIANGTVITPPVTTINYTAQIQCNSGYQLVGNRTLTCLLFSSGGGMAWDLPIPSCVPTTTTTSTTSTTATTTTDTNTTTPTTTTSTTTTTTTDSTSTATTPSINTTESIATTATAIVSIVPAVSTLQFIATLDPIKNGTDNIAAADQLNSAMEILLSGLTATQLKQLGFQQKDFITACLFGGVPCNNDEKLTLVLVPEFLNCYAFNHRDQTNLVTSERPGEKYGLSMTFNIQSEEYINTMSIAGVQLFVQDQFDPILPGSMGRIYSPGLLYYIIISKRVENQLPVIGRPCLTSAKENSFNLFQNDTYYTESCLRSYVQMNIIKNCGCGSAKYPLPNDNSHFCNLTTAKCATAYLSSNGTKLVAEAQVACPPACRSVSFDLTTTFARLSPQSSLDHLNMTKTSYMKNVVMVKLFFATDIVMVYSEKLNFDVMNVLSNIGGSVGCIAGISMISLVEILFMIAKWVAVRKNN